MVPLIFRSRILRYAIVNRDMGATVYAGPCSDSAFRALSGSWLIGSWLRWEAENTKDKISSVVAYSREGIPPTEYRIEVCA